MSTISLFVVSLMSAQQTVEHEERCGVWGVCWLTSIGSRALCNLTVQQRGVTGGGSTPVLHSTGNNNTDNRSTQSTSLLLS